MSIRPTVALDDDMAAKVNREIESSGSPSGADRGPRGRTLKIEPDHMGHKPGLNYDNIESLLEYGEGEQHR